MAQCAEPVIGRRFAPTRWLIAPYGRFSTSESLRSRDPLARPGYGCYFSELLTEVNLVSSCGPIACTLTTMASAMKLAIRQYSIAVAAVSSRRNCVTSRPIETSRAVRHPAARLGSNGCGEVEQHAEQAVKTERGL